MNSTSLNALEFQGTLLFKKGELHPLLLQVNGTTLNASEFKGTFLFKRGKLHPLLLPNEWHNMECIRVSRESPV